MKTLEGDLSIVTRDAMTCIEPSGQGIKTGNVDLIYLALPKTAKYSFY